MAHTGHKSESTIKTYARKCPAVKHHAMSKSLGNHLFQDESENVTQDEEAPPSKAPKPSKAIPVPTENPEVINAVIPEPDQSVQLPDNIVAIEMDDDEIEGDELVQILEKIEKENQHLFQNNKKEPQKEGTPPQVPNTGVVASNLNVANVANIGNLQQNFNKDKLPIMYFPGSNVTINYNFKN